jgi:NADP-dependent 3-hydroxy acid dehydrogenase YdfG
MTNPEIVVITGASAGVGRATAREFARRGAHIALIARGKQGLEAAAREVEQAGGRALAIPLDVSDAAQLEVAAALVEDTLGPIDIWINNAMTTVFARARDITPQEYARVTDVTYHGVVWGTRAALEHMIPRNRGCIVQVGSALAHRAIPLQAAYCGAKHAARAFTDSLRSELIHDRVDVHLTMVHLPGLNTPQFEWCRSHMRQEPQPVPPIYQPELAARAIYWAAHHRRREVYVGLPTLQAIAGNTLIPGVLDHFLARVAWDGQLTGEIADPTKPSNLFEPVPGDHGAHGRFGRRARARDRFTWWGTRLGAAGLRAAAITGALAAAALAGVALRALMSR